MKSKICLLTDSLSSGGAEKMAANMSRSLHNRGYKVFVVSMKDEIEYQYLGILFNFGKVKKSNNRLQAFTKFKQFFQDQNFDVIIDHRVRSNFFKEFLFAKFIFKETRVLYCVHHYNLELYFSIVNMSFLSRFVLVKNKNIIAVSRVVKQKIKEQLDLDSRVIYNYTIKKTPIESFSLKDDYVLAVGRLVAVKQFDKLIKSYNNSLLPKNNIKLLILGEGQQRGSLTKLIKTLNLEKSVNLMGFKKNIESYVKNAKALIMSSHSEGFPMVLIEALALKIPVISFDCPSGPSEIIQDEFNGLLVENQNLDKLTEAMNRLVLDNQFYNKIKRNLIEAQNPFAEEKITEQWVELIEC